MRERTAQKRIQRLVCLFPSSGRDRTLPPAINIRHKLDVHVEARGKDRERGEGKKEREMEVRRRTSTLRGGRLFKD